MIFFFKVILCHKQGGLRAVIWTDALQAVIMLVGLTLVCALGTREAGGATSVFETAKEIGRFNFDKWV